MLGEFKKKIHAYIQLTRLHKPVGIWLLLWPTIWGLILSGQGHPPITVIIIFVLGTVLMRSAGCVLNDIADRHFDGKVARTQFRPLVLGLVSVTEAYALAVGLVLLAFILVCFTNALTVWLSVPALLLAASYPYSKRFFDMPQAVLGIAFGFGIPMAYAAVQGRVPDTAWLMLLANVCWSIAYDTEYAMVDREDDLKIGIRSAAITFGHFDVVAVMGCFALMLALWALIAVKEQLAWPVWAGIAVAIVQIYQQYGAIKKRQRDACYQAFLNNVWLGLSLTLGLMLSYYVV